MGACIDFCIDLGTQICEIQECDVQMCEGGVCVCIPIDGG